MIDLLPAEDAIAVPIRNFFKAAEAQSLGKFAGRPTTASDPTASLLLGNDGISADSGCFQSHLNRSHRIAILFVVRSAESPAGRA